MKNSKNETLTMLTADRPEQGYACPKMKACGDRSLTICINKNDTCPINYIDVQRKERASLVDRNISLGDNLVIAYSGNFQPELPITQFRLELTKPCVHSFFQSGLSTKNNSIYQPFEFGYMVEDVHYVNNRSNVNPESMIDTVRYAKCPEDEELGQALDHRYDKVSSDLWDLSLK